MEMLNLELAQKDASRETTQKELLTSGRENLVSVSESSALVLFCYDQNKMPSVSS